MTANSTQTHLSTAHDFRAWRRWAPGIMLLLIVALGLTLRVATLGQQSLWFDEAHWVCKMVDSPTLSTWLQRSDQANRDMVPLYFILEYYWYHYIWASMTGMRWLSVLIGMMTVLMTYRFGRELYRPSVGLLAALCCALSPHQIYFSQELRPYGLLALLGTVSAYTFYRAVFRGGKRWWAINVVVNSLLMWTHLFGLWLIVTEGCYLLLFHIRPFRRTFLWSFVNAVLMIPVGLLVLTWTSPGQPPLGCNWLEIAATWLCMDVYSLAFLIYVRTTSLPRDLFVGLPDFLLYVFPLCAVMVSASFLAGAFLQVWRTFRNTEDVPSVVLPEAGPEVAGGTLALRRETSLFLLMWYVLPCLWIVLFTVLVVPAFQLRYVIYSDPALYLLAASGILSIGRPALRYGITGILLASLGVTAVLAMLLPVRPDYRGAARYVQTQFAEGEEVLWQPGQTRDTFLFNLDPALPAITAAGQSHIHEEFNGIEAAFQKGAGVWVLHGIWDPGVALVRKDVLERYLALRGIPYTKRVFPGRWDILVYHCPRPDDYQPPEAPESLARILPALTLDVQDIPIRWSTRRALERAKRFSEATEMCRRELAAVPSSPEALAALEEGLQRDGWNDWLEGSYVDDYVAELVSSLGRTLTAAGEHDAATREVHEWSERFPPN